MMPFYHMMKIPPRNVKLIHKIALIGAQVENQMNLLKVATQSLRRQKCSQSPAYAKRHKERAATPACLQHLSTFMKR